MNPKFLKTIGALLNFTAYFSLRRTSQFAFHLFCMPFAPPILQQHRSWIDKGRAGYIENNGNKIQYYKWGSGPNKILFLHGWKSHTFRWKNYIDQLPTDQYTVYAIDAPAHGLSEGKYFTMPSYAECVASFYKEIDQPHLIIGHSLGGMTTIFAAANYSEVNPKAIILLATATNMSDFMVTFQSFLGFNQRVFKGIEQYVADEFGQPPSYFNMVNFAVDLDIPGLIIHDPSDEIALIEHAQAIHKNWGNSEMIVTEGLDHKLRSEKVYSSVLGFIHKQFNKTEDSSQLNPVNLMNDQ